MKHSFEAVMVLSRTGKPLMPTTPYRARHLLKKKKAVIERHRPFTIRLTEREDGETQPVEYKCDTGYEHVGVSITSEKHEYVHDQYDMLPDETERHNDQRKYRRTRRNRKRYRKARFLNRTHGHNKSDKRLAPSVRHREENQVNIFRMYKSVMPITSAVFEMGQFDTQALKAVQEGKSLPKGTDYQHGERYGLDTLRAAVFTRDNYTCRVCGRTIRDHAILHVHHIGFWRHDRSNRPGNLMTVCEKCHTPKNHKPGGKLYGLKPKLPSLAGATYMTAVRWDMYERLKAEFPDTVIHLTYGVVTKRWRQSLNLKKTHANDAYAMGNFHPKHLAQCRYFKKRRRNNRILSKFYDARYIDIRTGEKKPASTLGCNRTNRRELRMSDKNERPFRGEKVSKGHASIRRKRYPVQAGDVVLCNNQKRIVHGVHNGKNVEFEKDGLLPKSASVNKVSILYHIGGWRLLPA